MQNIHLNGEFHLPTFSRSPKTASSGVPRRVFARSLGFPPPGRHIYCGSRKSTVQAGSKEDKKRAGQAGSKEDEQRAGQAGGVVASKEDKQWAGQACSKEDKQRAGQPFPDFMHETNLLTKVASIQKIA